MTKPLYDRSQVAGVILAGGRSRRMGGEDKSSLNCRGKSLLDRAIDRTAPQVQQLLISSNTLASSHYRGHRVVADSVPDFPGPLAGITSALAWCRSSEQHYKWLATFAIDTPFVPADFVAGCIQQAVVKGADVVFASYGDKHHYAMALWRTALQPYLVQRLHNGERALRVLLAECGAEPKIFNPDASAPGGDPFFNINTPADWQLAQRFLNAEVSG